MQTKKRNQSFFKKIAGIFIVNRELGVLTILFLVFFGVFGFIVMPKQYNPEIVASAFRITTFFPHATAEEVYELVTRPMENKVREIALVDDIYSQSRSGVSVVTVTFDIGSDEQNAKIDLVQRLRSNMNEKPIGVDDPIIEEIDVDDVPIVTLAMTSRQFSPEAVRSFALDLSDRIKHIDHVGKIIVRGGKRADLSVFLDIDKLQSFDVSVQDVHNAIVANNVHEIDMETDQMPQKIGVHVYGSIENSAQLKKIVVAQKDGTVVRVEDVARVEMQEMETLQSVRMENTQDGMQDVVLMGIAKQHGANATTVAKNIHKEITKLQEQNFIPSHVAMRVVRDDGVVAKDAIGGLTINLVQSIAIVVMILLFFLNTRSAMVVAVAIPLTLLSVFGFGMLFGQAINRITLFALILSLGLLVDNATVVVENIHRSLRLRKNDRRTTVIIDAVAEVSGGLIMSTVTTVLAFIPMAFVTGMMGPYMGPIPFFVPAAIIASLLIALTINPFIAHAVMRTNDDSDGGVISHMQKYIRRLVDVIEGAYVRFLQSVFRNTRKENVILISVGVLFVISMTLPAFGIVKFRMLPKADRNQFYVYIDANTGTHIEETDRIARLMSAETVKNPFVSSVQTTVATPPIVDFNGLFKGSDGRTLSSQATLKVNLIDAHDRKETSEEIAENVRDLLKTIAVGENVKIKIVEDPPGPPVMATYHIKVQGENRADYPVLRDMARELQRQSSQIDGVVDGDVSYDEHGLDRSYRINTEQATRLGVSVYDIMQTMTIISDGVHVGLYHDTLANDQKFAEQQYISLRGEKEDRNVLADIDRVTVRSANGSLVSLSALLDEVTMPVDDTILMDAQYPTVYISSEMRDRSVVYASIDMLSYLLKEYRLPSGKGVVDSWNLFGVHYIDADGKRYAVKIGGEWELTLEVFRDMGMAFVVAIFLIYFVLVAQFRSLKIPIYIMLTIPLALVGVLPGFMILYMVKGTYFNATSMIGVIALSGIVVNNAIIYLEYVFQKRQSGAPMDIALIEAGRVRLLPIILTSLTTILGSLTIVADPVWEGLAWTIVSGLSLSAVLTLVVLPIIYRRYEKSV